MVTNTIGKMVFDNDINEAENYWKLLLSGTMTFPEDKYNEILYLEVDGAMVAIRQDGKKWSMYKENKLGMVFSSDNLLRWVDKHGKHQHRIMKREYTSLIGDSETFTKLMFSLTYKNGYGFYKDTVIISDGATWIRNMKELIFPDAQQILDFYHLKEHISDYAKVVFNFCEDKYLPWVNMISKIFKSGNKNAALDVINKTRKKRSSSNCDKLVNYIMNNFDNIDYADYIDKGYFIGSGAIECSNKTGLQRCLKYGAMRWNIESAQAVVTLVSKARSGLWESDVIKPTYQKYAG